MQVVNRVTLHPLALDTIPYPQSTVRDKLLEPVRLDWQPGNRFW